MEREDAGALRAGGEKLRICVAEAAADFALTRELLSCIRSEASYAIEGVDTYDAALAALRQRSCDVLLVGCHFADIGALQVVRDATALGNVVPIIVLASYEDGVLERDVLAAGAADHLYKPELTPGLLSRSIAHSVERSRHVAAVRANETAFRAVFDGALDAMLVVDDNARCVDANASASQVWGMTREELCQKRLHDLDGLGAAGFEPAWRALLSRGTAAGVRSVLRGDGQERFIEFTARARILPGRHLVIMRDVTERRRAELVQKQLAAFIECSPDAVIGTDSQKRVTYWSPGAVRIFGYEPSEMLGESLRRLVPSERTEEFEKLIWTAGHGTLETKRLRKDGSEIDVMISFAEVHVDGEVVGKAATLRDITETKRLSTHLAVTDRLASMGALAAGMAHEINNPLAALVANMHFIGSIIQDIKRLPALPVTVAALAAEIDEPLSDCHQLGERVRHAVLDIKMLSRVEEERRAGIDVASVFESSLRIASNEMRHRARVVKDFKPVPQVYGNAARLGQVLLNLLVNSAQAIPEGNAAKNQVRLSTALDAAGMVVIEVEDTGCGIPEEYLDRIFEPFFTTKPLGIGTGLGLPICQRIVAELGGTMSVRSVVGRGTCFSIVLPPAPEHMQPAPEPPSGRVAASRPGKVLVVDDEQAIGRAIERTLAKDHAVLAVTSAAEALAHIRAGETFDIIICDLMMPQMTGMDLCEELEHTAPAYAQKLFFVAGGAFTARAQAFLDSNRHRFMPKPFDALRLLELVNHYVDDADDLTKPAQTRS